MDEELYRLISLQPASPMRTRVMNIVKRDGLTSEDVRNGRAARCEGIAKGSMAWLEAIVKQPPSPWFAFCF